MPANLENSAVVTGLEKVSFHSNPKEGQCQRMFKVPNKCTHFTHYQRNAQNCPSKASILHKPRTSRCSRWIEKRQRNKRSNCQHLLDHRKNKRVPEEHLLSYWLLQSSQCVSQLTVWITTNCGKFLKQWEYQIPDLPPEKSIRRSGSNS